MPNPATSEGSRFKVDPDPPQIGVPVEVTYIGPADEVEWQVDDQEPVKVKPDENGKFTISSVPSGSELMLSDNSGIPGYLHSDLIDFK